MLNTQKHYQKIDLLRGIAILAVFQAHFIWYFYPDYAGFVGIDEGHPAKKVILLNVLPRTIGWGGVTLFLLISGFLLHLGYLRDKETFTLRGFYSRRFWRVYPPYLLVLLAFSLFLEKDLFTTRAGLLTFLTHVFSIQNLFSSTYFSVNPTFWCLGLEVQLYLLYALFLYGHRRWGIKSMLAITFLVSIIWKAIGMRIGGLGNSPVWVNSAFALWVIWAAGAFLGEALHNGRSLPASLSRRDYGILIGGLVLAIFVTPIDAFLQYVAGLIGVIVMDALLRFRMASIRSRPGRLLRTIGLCSLSLFLIHQPLLRIWIDWFDDHSPYYRGYRLVNGVLVSLLIFCISYALYRWVELPSIRMGQRLRKEDT
jgi:peptidoglycan/LPS O-acetylase OafA/YrhL